MDLERIRALGYPLRMGKSRAAVSLGRKGGEAYRAKLIALRLRAEAGDREAAAELEKIRERARENGKKGGRPKTSAGA